jgi:L-threonylcarbamoyladenylate synthase
MVSSDACGPGSDTAETAIPSARVLSPPQLADRLAEVGACLFPTDTLPALAAQPGNAQEIWRLKERPAHKPLILMGADLDQLVDHLVGFDWREEWLQEATRRWPGAYTLVLPASFPCPITEALHPGGSSLGLRVPACPMTQALLRLTGPLATTSANRSGQAAATTAGLAGACFPHVPLLGPLPWPVGSGVASTVMAWRSQGQWDVLRRGAGMGPEVVSP